MILRNGDVSRQTLGVFLGASFFVVKKGLEDMYDVVIIGAGVVGAMIARLFSKYEGKVLIVDKESDIAMGATKANSAIVHAGFDAKAGSLKAKLNVAGSEMMEKICADLSVSYKNNGSLVIGYNDDDRKKLEELYQNGIKNGVRNLEVIDQEKLRALEPNISDEAVCALYAPTGAIVCPYELTEAAIGNAMDNGAELLLDFEVCKIERNDDCYEIYSKDERKVDAKIVINAAGVYSDEIYAMANKKEFLVHPRMGEYLLLDRECGDLVSHTIFTVPTKMGKGILVSPTVDNNLLLGPTSVDGTDKTDKNTTKAGIDSVIQNAKRMVKNVDVRMVITSFCGLRAVGDTGDFIIDIKKENFVNVAGIESPGLSASPAIAEYVKELLENSGIEFKEKENVINTRTSLKHFRDWDIDKKNEMIKKDPTFGNIICRCEGVTEGEIRHAIRTNPKPRDLDGVKRRTRAQMGRCQGGFCSPYIMGLLAEEMGVAIEQVTKSGKGSYVLTNAIKEENRDA